eukprot:TRINITY_DN29570_c0_g1_i1.p1 TRINITY_DN29570_c0_g1~~TRINITY_DN29570_c0_g1_i1.p1  ORF type:complete len:530 (+),score=121.00 TRINITY_DN29570_c0_g1_i1:218-1807(+)
MFRASDIFGAPAGPKGPAQLAASRNPVPSPARPTQVAVAAAAPGLVGRLGGVVGVNRDAGQQRAGPYSPPVVQVASVGRRVAVNVASGGSGPSNAVAAAPTGYGVGPLQKWKLASRPVVRHQPTPQPTPNSIVVQGNTCLMPGDEKDIEECVREVCIQGCISIADEVRYVTSSVAYIDFPYHEACLDFMKASGGTLKVKHRTFRLQHSTTAQVLVQPLIRTSEESETKAADGTVLDHPTDTLMVRQIGEMTEEKIKKAFQAFVPAVRGVRIPMDRHTRKTKGFGFVSFYTVGEAVSAISRLQAVGSMIDGRKVAISFAKPQTHEQMLESDMNYHHEQNQVQVQQQQALSGINADMWANYFQFVSEEKEKKHLEREQKMQETMAAAQSSLEGKRESGNEPYDPRTGTDDGGDDSASPASGGGAFVGFLAGSGLAASGPSPLGSMIPSVPGSLLGGGSFAGFASLPGGPPAGLGGGFGGPPPAVGLLGMGGARAVLPGFPGGAAGTGIGGGALGGLGGPPSMVALPRLPGT